MAVRPMKVWNAATSTWDDVAVSQRGDVVNKTDFAAKGDIIAGTGASAYDNVTAGSDGQMLIADSSVSTGLRYVDPVFAGRNLIINGQFSTWQRGSTFTNLGADGTYTADRWYVERGGNMNVTRRSLGSNTPPSGFTDYAECLNKTASNPFILLGQAIETSTTIPLRNKSVTVSFYARAAADTVKSKSVSAQILSSTSTDTKTGGTGTAAYSANLNFGTDSTSWQRFSFTRIVPADCSTLRVNFFQAPAGGLAVDDGFHLAGVQVEVSPVATPFEFEPFEATLRKCQRYYVRFDNTGGSTAHSLFAPSGKTESTTQAICYTPLPVAMRVVPISVEYGGTLSVDATGGAFAPSALTMQDRSTNKVASVAYNVTGATAQQFTTVRANNSTSAYVGFSAEL